MPHHKKKRSRKEKSLPRYSEEEAAIVIQRCFRQYAERQKFRIKLLTAVWNTLADDEERTGLREAVQMTELRKILFQTKELVTLRSSALLELDPEHDKRANSSEAATSDGSEQKERPKLTKAGTQLLEAKYLDEAESVPEGHFNVKVPEKLAPDFVELMEKKFRKGMVLSTSAAREILTRTIALLSEHSSLSRVARPNEGNFTVVGDTHGQLADLLTIFKHNGPPSETNWYLINGDMVDRGMNGVEIVLLVCAWKLVYPEAVHMNRGNHEALAMNNKYAFDEEVCSKYDKEMFELFQDLFCHLPLATVFADDVFIVHGGLATIDNVRLEDIERIDHRHQPPSGVPKEKERHMFKEMLWNDPRNIEEPKESSRGSGIHYFGEKITSTFLETNQLSLVIRSHEVEDAGYKIMHSHQLITVFSASNYCGKQNNFGAYVVFNGTDSELKPSFHRYHAEPIEGLVGASGFSISKLESEVLQQLNDRIFIAREHLESAFMEADEKSTGTVPVMEWKHIMSRVLGLPLPYLSLRSVLFHEDYPIIVTQRGIDYLAFLHRYKISLTTELVVKWEKLLLEDIISKVLKVTSSLESSFDRFDVDNDGRITAAEIVQVAREHDIHLKGKQVSTLKNLIDVPGGLTIGEFRERFDDLHRRLEHQSQREELWMRSAIRAIIDIMERDKKSIRKAFASFDKYERGELSYKRFAHAVKSLLDDRLNKKQRYALAEYIDTDCNKSIDFAEFESAFSDLARRQEETKWMKRSIKQLASALVEHRQNLKATFREFDIDQSGTIDMDEFRTAMTVFNRLIANPLDDEQITILFHALDSDSSGAIDWQEFLECFSVTVKHAKSRIDRKSKSQAGNPDAASSSSSTEPLEEKEARLQKWEDSLKARQAELDERERKLNEREQK